ncbi:MAG: hypothetical protein MUC34_02655 [Anaerolineae bacterium]|nr:hypothetical protein [Anaerolineae bacterium]
MTNPRLFPGRLALLLAVLLLAACAPLPAGTPAPTASPAPTMTMPPPPTAAPPPSPAPAPTATLEPTATADPFEGWKTITTDTFSISVPADWEVIDLTEEEIGALIEQLELKNKVLAAVLERTPNLTDFELIALAPPVDGFADNLNIKRAPLGAEPVDDLEAWLRDALLPQYGLMGLKPWGERSDLVTDGGLPMARVMIRPPTSAGGPELRGRQYFVLTDTDMWALSYSTLEDRGDRPPTEFEKSARSFAPR